ncbi:MAG: CDP-alcohol phosphatidyltransferase family protein, partial [Proteobacteria bacterium]|nr:CDP-alcohol phosphatidyltransferase family protein [Pseudomonadota bacterium]
YAWDMRAPDVSTSSAGSWLTLANGLTLGRLLAAPLCACAIAEGRFDAALLLFAFAVATDFADGPVARRRGEDSARGGLFDHLTDAIFAALGLAALAEVGEVPALLPWLVAAAFAQYTLDSRALSGAPLRASALGRWNGIAYFVLLGTPLVRDALGLAWPSAAYVQALGWALVATTLVSMADRGLALMRQTAASRRRAPETPGDRRRDR